MTKLKPRQSMAGGRTKQARLHGQDDHAQADSLVKS